MGRSPDDPDRWVLGTRWRDAGSLRHGLGAYDAKVALGPLQTYSTGDDIVVEVLVDADADGVTRASATGPTTLIAAALAPLPLVGSARHPPGPPKSRLESSWPIASTPSST